MHLQGLESEKSKDWCNFVTFWRFENFPGIGHIWGEKMSTKGDKNHNIPDLFHFKVCPKLPRRWGNFGLRVKKGTEKNENIKYTPNPLGSLNQ